jgi:hypothetical protein
MPQRYSGSNETLATHGAIELGRIHGSCRCSPPANALELVFSSEFIDAKGVIYIRATALGQDPFPVAGPRAIGLPQEHWAVYLRIRLFFEPDEG